MTANILMVCGDGIAVFSDGMAYDADGVIGQIHTKQIVLADCETVITYAGSGGGLAIMQYLIGIEAPRSFDEVSDKMVTWAREVLATMERVRSGPDRLFYLYGGWSSREQVWKAFVLSSNDEPSADLSAFTPVPVTSYARPSPSPEALAEVGIDNSIECLEANGEPAYCLKLMLAMRKSKQPLGHHSTKVGYTVGGFIEYTHLSREAFRRQIVIRWADEVGKLPDPSEDVPIDVGPSPQT